MTFEVIVAVLQPGMFRLTTLYSEVLWLQKSGYRKLHLVNLWGLAQLFLSTRFEFTPDSESLETYINWYGLLLSNLQKEIFSHVRTDRRFVTALPKNVMPSATWSSSFELRWECGVPGSITQKIHWWSWRC